MNLAIELEQEDDGRWIAEIDELDGVLVYGATDDEAIKNVKTLALRVFAPTDLRMARVREHNGSGRSGEYPVAKGDRH